MKSHIPFHICTEQLHRFNPCPDPSSRRVLSLLMRLQTALTCIPARTLLARVRLRLIASLATCLLVPVTAAHVLVPGRTLPARERLCLVASLSTCFLMIVPASLCGESRRALPASKRPVFRGLAASLHVDRKGACQGEALSTLAAFVRPGFITSFTTGLLVRGAACPLRERRSAKLALEGPRVLTGLAASLFVHRETYLSCEPGWTVFACEWPCFVASLATGFLVLLLHLKGCASSPTLPQSFSCSLRLFSSLNRSKHIVH
jgi:hypothetical protein